MRVVKNTENEDSPGPAGKTREKVGNIIWGPPGGGRGRICSGGLGFNGGPGPSDGGCDWAGDDGPSSANRSCDVGSGDRTPHINEALDDESTEERGRPAKRRVSCPAVRRPGSASPPSPASDSRNRALKALSLSRRARMR